MIPEQIKNELINAIYNNQMTSVHVTCPNYSDDEKWDEKSEKLHLDYVVD